MSPNPVNLQMTEMRERGGERERESERDREKGEREYAPLK